MFKFLCIPLFLLFPLGVYGQFNDRITAYTVNDGLVQSTIDDIIQDKDGFMWIGTAGGLCRFDGYSFKTYRPHSKQPRSAPSERGYHFFNDSRNRLWMVSFNGISLYNSSTDDFTNIISYEPRKVITSENHIYGEDARYIWAGLNNYGMVRVDKHTLRAEIVPIPGLNNTEEQVSWYRGFMENGKLWIIANRQFVIYNTKSKTSARVDIPAAGLINLTATQAIGFDHRDVLLIDKRKLSWERIPVSADGADHNIVSMKNLSATEVLLCSTSKGLFYLDVPAKKIVRRISEVGDGRSKPLLTAVCAYRDWSGNIWIGSFGQGVFRFAYPYRNFRLYRSDDVKSSSVFSIYVDSVNVYSGSSLNGLNVFSRKTGAITNIGVNNRIPAILNRAAITCPVEPGKLFMVGYSSLTGVPHKPLTYDTRTQKIAVMNEQVTELYRTLWGPGNLRNFALPDPGKGVLTNVGEYLISIRKSGENRFLADTVHRFKGEMLSCGFWDRSGRLWIGTYKGVYLLSHGKWKEIRLLPKRIEIKTISQDKDGNLWMGTNYGIYVLDQHYKIKQYYTEENQLVNEHVYGILQDNDGNMWFSHNKGLSVYNWNQRRFRHFSVEDGLQSTEFNAVAYFKAKDGELFFGGINGISAFYPREILDNPHVPLPRITSIQLFDEPLSSDTAHWNIRSLRLPYTANSLSFEFILPEFTNPDSNRYSYFMEGVDRDWTRPGTGHFARYPSLKPGNYTLKVKAANSDGVWSKEESISITIVPPFWQRTWFRLLVSIGVMGVIVWIISAYQEQKYKKKMRAFELQQKVQAERERISRDLHDNVGTQLSLISKSIEGALFPLQVISETERETKLFSVSQASKEVIATLRETIWALNKEEISLGELSDKLRSFTQKQLQHVPAITLEYFLDEKSEAVILQPAEAIHLFRICQEAIANSLKYAEASRLNISIGSSGGKYQIAIADNGTGFSGKQEGTGLRYGIENMKFRSSEIGCTLLIHSQPGKGTHIMIRKN